MKRKNSRDTQFGRNPYLRNRRGPASDGVHREFRRQVRLSQCDSPCFRELVLLHGRASPSNRQNLGHRSAVSFALCVSGGRAPKGCSPAVLVRCWVSTAALGAAIVSTELKYRSGGGHLAGSARCEDTGV